MLSQNMGYNVFGFRAGNYVQGMDEGFKEYERLLSFGYSKEEALKRAMLYSGVSIAGNKLFDKGVDFVKLLLYLFQQLHS